MNGPPVTVDPPPSGSAWLSSRLAAVLRLEPSAPALQFEDRWFRLGDLAASVEALIAQLDASGAEESTPVGVVLANRPEHVVAMIAVLSTRRCLVVLNATQGTAGLQAEVERARLDHVIVSATDAPRIDGLATLHIVDGPPTSPVLRQFPPVHGRIAANDAAIDMPTSGTTGPPKRIELSYTELGRSLRSARRHDANADYDHVALSGAVAIVHQPLVHVSGLWRTLDALLSGRRIALIERFSVDAWHRAVLEHRPVTTSLVPAALRMVLDARLPPKDLVSLRSVVSSTAPLDATVAAQFEDRYGVVVLTVYGATEFAGGVAGWTLADRLTFGDEKRGSVGRAQPGVRLRVVDDAENAVPPGTAGVLQVSVGKDAAWTTTTDMARIDGDGFVYIDGRRDTAIIRGGFKIDPAGVESVLRTHPAIHDACVVGRDDRRLGQVPVAVVELREAHDVDPAEVLGFVRERITGYSVPVAVLVVDKLPRTDALKVRRGAVAEMVGHAAAPNAGPRP